MDFVVIILGRTSNEWAGQGMSEELEGRAGFNSFGSPAELVDNLDRCSHSQFFDRDALLRASRVVLCLVDVCQPEIGECLAVEHPTRPIIFDRRRLDFNDLGQLAELPVAHLILHDKRTLQIFAYSGCIPFLLNNRLNQSGTFLVHGLKKDALYDMSQDNLDNAIKALHVPPSLDDAQQATSDHDSIDAVFRVLVEVQLEDEVANDIQRDDDVDKDSDSKMSSHQVLDHVDIARSLVLAVPCHPEDSVEALRLRLYDLRRRQNSSTDERFQDGKDGSSISGSIRGNSNYSSLNDFEGRWELPIGFEICRAPVGIAEGVRRAPEVSRSTPWLPFKHASLLAALRAARCDTSGRLPTLLRAPQQVQQLLPLAPHKTRVHASDSAESLPVSADEEIGNSHDSQPLPCNETRLRTPLLQPHGSPGLPLRRTALASSLGIDHDCGVQGCAHRFCCQDNRKLSLPPSNNLAMRSMSAESCPLTGVEGLVFLGVSP